MQRNEDLILLDQAPLPSPAPIALPENIPSGAVDDIAFVSQFVMSYKDLLTKPESVVYSRLTIGEHSLRDAWISCGHTECVLYLVLFNVTLLRQLPFCMQPLVLA